MLNRTIRAVWSTFVITLVATVFAALAVASHAEASPVFGLNGTYSVSKTTLWIGEEFTLNYKIDAYASGGASGTAFFRYPKIVQPIPYGFVVVSYSGPVYNDEVEIKYNELRITFNDFHYNSGQQQSYEISVKLVYKGKPAKYSFGNASLSYVVNDDWNNPGSKKIPVSSLTFKNRITGPSTFLTEPTLEGSLTGPPGVIFVQDPFTLSYTLTPNIEIERRDQSDYIVLWNISASMSERYVPSDSGTPRKIDAARSGFAKFIEELRRYYPGDTEENYTALPNVGTVETADAAIAENRYTSSLTKSKPLKRRTGPQVGTAPRVTLIPFHSGILYDHIIEQTNQYTYLLSKVNSLSPVGSHTDVTRALHETMDYILYEREHGDPDYQPMIIMVTDGNMDSVTRIRNEKYETCYCTTSKTAGEINRSVEGTYDFDNLYLAMSIPLYMIKLSDPSNKGLNYLGGFSALENIVSLSGGKVYSTIDDDDRSYGGKNYKGVKNAFVELVNLREANKKPWARYEGITVSQTLPAGMKLTGVQPSGVTLSGNTLKIPVASFSYNSGSRQIKLPVQLSYSGPAAVYNLAGAKVTYSANSTSRQNELNTAKLTFKVKSPPKAEVDAPDAPDVVVTDSFLIVRGKKPEFSVKATDEEKITSLQYAFMKQATDPLSFKEVSGSGGLGRAYNLNFNGNGGTVQVFDSYEWYKLTIKVANSLGLSTTKVVHVLVLPDLGFTLEPQEEKGNTVASKPIITSLKWVEPLARRPVKEKFSLPGLTAAVEYSLGGRDWTPAPFDKLQIIRSSSIKQLLKVRIIQKFEKKAVAPFNAIQFKNEQSVYLSINYDQKKF